MRRVLLGAILLGAVTSGSGGAAPLAVERACTSGEHAVIRGAHRCLRHGGACRWQDRPTLRRHGFTCASRRLVDEWRPLRRPLQLARLDPGSGCPRAQGREVDPSFAKAYGPGPVYAVGLGEGGVAPLRGIRREGGWWYYKILWVAHHTYAGPALIRGGRIDGAGRLRFEWGATPDLGLWFEAGAVERGFRERPSYTRLRAPGCYAWQVDTLLGTEIVAFEAVP